MKRYLLFLALIITFTLQAQAPQGFNYQATVRNSTGDLIVNTNVDFRFKIMQGSQTSPPVFTEIHLDALTDDLGQVNLVIGQGTATTGAFSSIDWSLGSYYLGIELDTGNGYVGMGITQLLSVPYALYAENSGNSTPTTPNLQSVLAENNSANNQQIKDLQDPTDAQDAVTKAYVDTEVLNNNQNIELVLTQGNNANGLQLKGIADPTEAQDAVTKAYADALSSTQGLMNFNGWDNYQISNDNSTFQLEPNSFLFLNANDITLILPQGGNYGDVVYIYVVKPATNGRKLYLQPNGTPYAYLDYDFNLYTNNTETVYGTFGHGSLQILFKTSDYWMCSNFQVLDPNVIDNDFDGYTENQGDCDDDNAQVNPGATEIEDGIDNDCDGDIDEGFDASGTVTDIDGNTYNYLTYGNQVWTVENAEMVTYRDGTPIPQVTDYTEWESLTTGAWSYYENNPSMPRLYNWYAVAGIHDTDPNTPNKEFAPEGWHVPTDAEWTTLEEYLIANGYNYDGTTTENKIAKAMASTTGWDSSTNTGAVGNDQSLNNDSGFNAFPEGCRILNGSFYNEGVNAIFWSSTELNTGLAWSRYLFLNDSNLFRLNDPKKSGFSVRFVRDSDVDQNDIDNDGDGYTPEQGDCDDNDAQVNPGATEIEDGIDNDCDGEVDEGFEDSGTVDDIDGNTYNYLTYGNQVWTVENAEMVTYRDGTPIPQVTDYTEWESLTTGAWSYYENNPSMPRLYNWYAVAGIHDTDPNTPNKEFAPEGWHVPSDAEWTTLENYLIANGYNYDQTTTENKIAKAMASITANSSGSGWISSTTTGAVGNDQSLNNSSGFNVYPEGFRKYNGSFLDEGSKAFFWSYPEANTDLAWYRSLNYNYSYLYRSNYLKRGGFSVRFVRD